MVICYFALSSCELDPEETPVSGGVLRQLCVGSHIWLDMSQRLPQENLQSFCPRIGRPDRHNQKPEPTNSSAKVRELGLGAQIWPALQFVSSDWALEFQRWR